MRILFIVVLSLLFTGHHSAQNLALENDFEKFEKSHKDSLSPDLYIDAAFYNKYGLMPVSKNINRMQVYSHPGNFDSPDFMRVCDIRWVFKTPEEALAFHKKYLEVNAEYGEEITDYKFKISKVNELRVYRENLKTRYLNASLGFPMNFYYFLFVKDNVVAKVFVNTIPTTTIEQASVFAKEAADRVNSGFKNKSNK